jgi:8-oxo-dGTP pyrophosphatase MutT (NUDIX family)
MDDLKQSWQTLSIENVYENAWIRVEEHQVVNPSGRPGIYGKVCFKNRAVGILPLDEQQNLYLVGQYRYTLGEYSWELPMGGASSEESTLGAARRELKEETGITANRWAELMRLHTSNSVTDELGIVYLARALQIGEPQFEETEVLALRKLSLEEAHEWVMQGRITDAISVAGILRLWIERDRLRG